MEKEDEKKLLTLTDYQWADTMTISHVSKNYYVRGSAPASGQD